MHQGETPRPDPKLTRRLRLARSVLLWERLWPVLWPVLGVAGLFLAIALFDVLPLLPGWLHAAILTGFAAAFGFFVWRAWRLRPLPGPEQGLRRLERDSGLSHRPLSTLSDSLATAQDDPLAQALWQAHRRRIADAIGRLKVALPSPGLPARDPWGLRAVPVLLLAIAVAGGWRDAPARLSRALSPGIAALTGLETHLQVWITPPAYTGLPPVHLQAPTSAAAPAIAVPAGSAVLGLLQGGWGTARLMIDDKEIPFTRQDDDSQRLDSKLSQGRSLGVEQGGRSLARWPVAVVPDAAPGVSFVKPPEAGERGRLRLEAVARDDYGVTKLWATIRRPDIPAAESITLDLPLPGGRAKTVRSGGWQDLTAHPWAGLPVTIQLTAQDELGQTGSSDPVAATLPERNFTHPVARAIIQQRRILNQFPLRRLQVMTELDSIVARPGSYADDTVVFLALRVASFRLFLDSFPSDLASVGDILWNTALRIEDGNLPEAERNLEQARRDLEQALADNASNEEIQRLIDQMQAALQQYLQAMAEQMQRQGIPPLPADQMSQMLTGEDLQRMLNQMRDLANTGSRQSAQQMLSDLNNLLQNLQSQPQGGFSPEEMQAAQALNDLQKLAQQQRDLRDQTSRQAQQRRDGMQGGQSQQQGQQGPQGQPPQQGQQGRGGQQPGGEMQQGAAAQENLRRKLGEVMRQLGEGMGDIPQPLGQAEQAMRDAVQDLKGNQPGLAAEAQDEALQRLQEGARGAMQQLSQRMGQGGLRAGMGRGGRDPLGRPYGFGPGQMDDETTKIPTEAETHKAHEILQELRRRAGEQSRPTPEKDYLHRLLRQF